MTSLTENRSVNENAADKKCSEKYTAIENQKTQNDLAQGGDCQKNSLGFNNSKAGYKSLYESLIGYKTQQEKSVFRGMMYLASFLLVLIFLTAVASLALSLAQFNMSPGMFPPVYNVCRPCCIRRKWNDVIKCHGTSAAENGKILLKKLKTFWTSQNGNRDGENFMNFSLRHKSDSQLLDQAATDSQHYVF